MLLNTKVQAPNHVLSQNVNVVIDRLWSIVWDLLKGEPRWCVTSDEGECYRLSPYWQVSQKNVWLSQINGSLDGKRYKIELRGLSHGHLGLASEELGCQYVFTDDLKYGNFSVSGSIYLFSGSSFYKLKEDSQESHDFVETPFLTNGKKWLMTTEKELEAIGFINRLCDAIVKAEAT